MSIRKSFAGMQENVDMAVLLLLLLHLLYLLLQMCAHSLLELPWKAPLAFDVCSILEFSLLPKNPLTLPSGDVD